MDIGKYASRTIKYLIRMAVVIIIVLALMKATGLMNTENGTVMDVLFRSRNGWILLGLLLVLALSYPKYSFTTSTVKADMDRDRKVLDDAFAVLGYAPEKIVNGKIVYRMTKPVKRLLMQYDDAVTVIGKGAYIEMEGLKKVVLRIQSKVEYELNENR